MAGKSKSSDDRTELEGQLSIDDILARGSSTHRFPWHDVPGTALVAAVAELSAAGCTLYLGTVGYGVLGQVRVYTPDGSCYSAVCHTSQEMHDTLRALGCAEGPRWVAENAVKSGKRGSRR